MAKTRINDLTPGDMFKGDDGDSYLVLRHSGEFDMVSARLRDGHFMTTPKQWNVMVEPIHNPWKGER